MQERFPGIGNWMADEILWRARLHPCHPGRVARPTPSTRALWEQVRWVSRTAIRIISDDWTYPPTWLFAHRWEAGGPCPRCRTMLERATVGGRTTCWCPGRREGLPAGTVCRQATPYALKSRWLNATIPTTTKVASSASR